MDNGTHSNGIPINIKNKSHFPEQNLVYNSSTDKEDSAGDNYHDDGLSEFERFGKTPPRTRILRRMRERNQKHKETGSSVSKTNIKIIHSNKSIVRRNTVTTIFNEMVSNADDSDSYLSAGSKRASKRSMKLLRGSERDLKLDITTAVSRMLPQPKMQVESSNRFMSLCSRLVACPNRAIRAFPSPSKPSEVQGCPQSRVDFYKTFSSLIKMGCGEKQVQERITRRHASREENLWQNELKDLIWLELQAWHADRSLTDQDTYIYEARQSVAELLNQIITYRFQKPASRPQSVHSADSGVDTEEGDCSGCLSMYCHPCMEAQNYALQEVEKLMKRLESAEALYPSSKAFAEDYPLYNSPELVGRVKAMCLWYNMTKNHRLKLMILGRLLVNIQSTCRWPLNLGCTGEDVHSDSASPSDSNSSTNSPYISGSDTNKKCDNYCISPLVTLYPKDSFVSGVSPYRKYIEDVLKTKGLGQALQFLERLHRHVLCKAQITLEKPPEEAADNENGLPSSDTTEYDELRRYGYWSKESQALGLPSYRSAFLFLSAVPLEVIHEFLRMRLEQKPEKPSPLSVRQLMREFKEGLTIAVVQRERVLLHVKTACSGKCEETMKVFKKSIIAFDVTLEKVLEVYLEYLEQWALVQSDICQKNFLEAEWIGLQKSCMQIEGGVAMVATKLCHIVASILTVIGEDLISKIESYQAPEEKNKKQSLFVLCREFQTLFNDAREKSVKIIAFTKSLMKDVILHDKDYLKDAIVTLKHSITLAIDRVQEICDSRTPESLDESEKAALNGRCREVLLQGYRFGFEFHKEMAQFMPAEYQQEHPESGRKFALSMIQFAHLWMEFARDRCERGRGMRPRWAYQGLDFLMTVCEPQNTMHLTEEEFDELKSNMDACISHVIGTTAPNTPDSYHSTPSPRLSLDHIRSHPRSRGSSPIPRAPYKSQRSQRKPSTEQSPDLLDSPDIAAYRRKEEPILVESDVKVKFHPAHRSERVRDAVQALDQHIDNDLHEQELIGRVINAVPENKYHIRKRIVTFSWQRGIKIGQGRFGKVYTAVNNNTGEMMAMKEIPFQYNDVKTIKKLSEEIRILEGISHPNLVKYFGIEIHREEMLIFMEFCSEGTLESLVAGTESGLPELLVRRYTMQLISGVNELHNHGVVHRDIKSANIFLTDEGNCLKIGDFGSAVKIKAHTTMPGELQGFVGTQAYMAPEVFMKNSAEGHGRAADIWSVGCVVVEMASGKRPWADFDSNYQVMFKVGMGERPETPESMSEEGQDFVEHCLQHNPKERATAGELLDHNFVKVDDAY